ncbi:hypothetical protein ABT348_31870 [Streptomyces olivaceus]|uniref:hypothetical protein n=1 Tax=Streptomyces olivaceus TaxID=47716 RepID=UPI0033183CBC
MNRGEIWTLPDGRNVLIISLTGLEEAYGAVLALVLHDIGRYPDTAMSVVIGDPLPCTAVAVNIVQLRVDRFDGAKLLGPVEGRRTVLLDDTARSGTSLLRSTRLLRIGGAMVGTAVCVLDRDAGATALLADHHLVLRALVRDPDGAR